MRKERTYGDYKYGKLWGGGVTSPYVWIEYKVNTNTWNTTEWVEVGAAPSVYSEDDSSRDTGGFEVTGFSTYTINQSTGDFIPGPSVYRTADSSDREAVQAGLWVRRYSDGWNKITWVDSIKYTGHHEAHKNDPDKSYDVYYGTAYYSKALITQSVTIPHTSTSVDWDTIVKVHLTEQTGQQFKKYPLVE